MDQPVGYFGRTFSVAKYTAAPLEDLIFHLQLTVAPAQLRELLFLRTGQPIGAALVRVGLGDPVPQTRLGNLQLLGELGDRFVPGAGHGPLPELCRVWGRHRRHPSCTTAGD